MLLPPRETGKPITWNKALDEVTKHIHKWSIHLFLTEWKFTLSSTKEDDEKQDDSTVLTVEVLVPYKKAHVTVHKEYLSCTPRDREEAVLHELFHCHTEQITNLSVRLMNDKSVTRGELEETNETLTQTLTNILFKAFYGRND